METCEETYGFLPCSSSLGGSIALMIAYGFLLLKGANYLSGGSELLLEVLDPGLIGGLLLPILGALPDSLIIVFSGLGVSKENAQEQVAVGIGTLAGSTIMLLTIAWGGSVLLGRCDLDNQGRAKDKKLTRGWDLMRTGVTSDKATPLNAIIMIITALFYLIVQIPAFMGITSDPKAALAGAIVCLGSLAAYCTYQVVYPELQRRKMDAARRRRMRLHAVGAMAAQAQRFGFLLDANGNLNVEVVNNLFDGFDEDRSGHIDEAELKALLLGLTLGADNSGALEKEMEFWMSEFDKNRDGSVSREEFQNVIGRWISEKQQEHRSKQPASGATDSPTEALLEPDSPLRQDDVEALGGVPEGSGKSDDEDDDDDSDEGEPSKEEKEAALTPRQLVKKAVIKLIIGTAICAIFSDPMVGAVSSFSTASGIPAFFVAFVVTPFASNASELVSSLQFASKKREKNISLTFSQVYGAATMNNTMVLGLFLLVVYIQEVAWVFTSEVIVIIGATLAVGLLGASSVTFKTWVAFPVLAIYPITILLVYIGDNVLYLDQSPQ